MRRFWLGCFCTLGIALSSVGHAAERAWADAKSGREFVLLDGQLSFNDAERECLKRGMVVSDQRYLNDDERKQFFKADAISALDWETQFAGTRRDVQLGRLWQSAGLNSVISETGYTTLTLLKKGGELSLTQEFKNGSTERANAVCMAVPAFWFYCNMELRCSPDGTATGFAWRYKFHDYGPSQNEAVRQIVERSQEPRWSVSTQKCVLQTESMHCLRVHPKF